MIYLVSGSLKMSPWVSGRVQENQLAFCPSHSSWVSEKSLPDSGLVGCPSGPSPASACLCCGTRPQFPSSDNVAPWRQGTRSMRFVSPWAQSTTPWRRHLENSWESLERATQRKLSLVAALTWFWQELKEKQHFRFMTRWRRLYLETNLHLMSSPPERAK